MTRFKPDARGRCPHCLATVKFARPARSEHACIELAGREEALRVNAVECPNCGRLAVSVETLTAAVRGKWVSDEEFVVWPRQSERSLPPAVPRDMVMDYKAAALLLGLNAAASAALSRRCLQAVLRDTTGEDLPTLSKQIQAAAPHLPPDIGTRLNALGTVGKFAAHPSKDTDPGRIVDAEPGEAEWNLNVLDLLFDHYYVRPDRGGQGGQRGSQIHRR